MNMEKSESLNTVIILAKYVERVRHHFEKLGKPILKLDETPTNKSSEHVSYYTDICSINNLQDYIDSLCKEFEKQDQERGSIPDVAEEGTVEDDSSYDSDYEGSEEPKHDDVSRTVSDTLCAEFSEYVSISSSPSSSYCCVIPSTASSSVSVDDTGYISRVEFALKLGYTEKLVQAALQKLGPNPEQNELLAELIKLGAQTGTKSKYDVDNSEDSSELFYSDVSIAPAASLEIVKLRPIVIDGSNVAMSHGNNEVFSCRGIKICVDWFRARGHNEITVFVPKWRKESPRPDNFVIDQDILSGLEKERLLVFTPSREVRGKRMVCYDDRYILKLAAENDGIVVSNDNYRDLVQECPEFRKVVEERILMYSFVNDRFMPPDDPLGRSGPTLDNFLKGQLHKKADNCPYGKKCTYGNKCKYNHPERGLLPHKSITERLAERAQKQIQARNQETGKQIMKGKSLSVPLQSSSTADDSNMSKAMPKKTALSRTKSTTGFAVKEKDPFIKRDVLTASSYDNQRILLSSLPPQQWHSPPSTLVPSHSTAPQSSTINNPLIPRNVFVGNNEFVASSSPGNVVNSSGISNDGEVNVHRKLQRELSINPAFDSRLYQMQKFQHSPTAEGPPPPPPHHPHHHHQQHQNLSRHYSFQTSPTTAAASSLMVPPHHNPHSHCNVTRIASAPCSNPTYTIPQHPILNNIASSSDSRINLAASVNLQSYGRHHSNQPIPPSPNWNLSASSLTSAVNLAGYPPLTASTGSGTTTAVTTSNSNGGKEEARQKLRYHLSSIFPENQVNTVMQMYPNETNPQKICAAIITMFPGRS